ncbi:MAG: DUF4236 domain-containing protein [Chthoniobacteraceae bacterium]
MGWSFRKSIRLGKGLRLNLSKRGLGWSFGSKALRFGFGGGRTRVSSGFGPFRYHKTLNPGSAPSGGRGCGCLTLVVAVFVVGGIASLFRDHTPQMPRTEKKPGGSPLPRAASSDSSARSVTVLKDSATGTSRVSPPAPIPNGPTTPRPLPTGHAADAAKWRAVALYPRLGVVDSPLNRSFVERVRRYQSEKPRIFDDPEWPTVIARECVAELGQ